MNHVHVLKRVWKMLWSYRALWLFGIVLAVVTSAWSTWMLYDRDVRWEERGIVVTQLPGETWWEALDRTMRQDVDQANRELSTLLAEELGVDVEVNVLVLAAVLVAIAVITYVAARIARYVSETALIRMVGYYQETGERLSVGQGLRLGWSRSAWRLFMIDLLVSVLAVLAGLLLFGLILGPLPLWVDGGEGVIFTFAFLTGGLLLMAVVVVIVAATGIAVLKRLAYQACALDDLKVIPAIRQGWRVMWQHLKDTGLVWLITFGLRVVWPAVIVPVVFLLLGVGLLLAGLPAVAVGGLAGLLAAGDTPVFVGLALGIPIFLLILIAPLAWLNGLGEVFVSGLWTLTYQELQGLEKVAPEPQPAVGAPGLEAAPVA
ncbi:MAG: hypothetical protein PVI59_04655 [Anaerolineae bacterium]